MAAITVSDNMRGGAAGDDEMNRAIDDVTAERLLRGDEVAEPLAGKVARVLALAAVPGSAEDMIGQDAVMAAFATAQLGGRGDPQARHRKTRTLTKIIGLKVAAVVVAATAGGLALAASTGVLPNPLHPTPRPSTNPSVHPSLRPSPVPSAVPSHPAASPAAALAGLCRAYLASDQAERGANLASAAFRELITAAGGTAHVEAYCVALAAPAASQPSHHPTGKPSARPSPATAVTPGSKRRNPQPSPSS